jgi:AcrR family transcriptional regulator
LSGQNTQDGPTEKGAHDRLVERAEELFCARGFNETSVRDIAAAAGCNVAAINYYFGGKDNLYVEVWRRRLTQVREVRLAGIDRVMSGGRQPELEELLRSYANSFVEPLVEGGQSDRLLSFMAREMVDPHLPREMFLSEMVLPVMNATSEALRRICPWLEERQVRLTILSIVGQLMHAVIIGGMFERGGRPDLLQWDFAEVVEHVVRFSAAGIRSYYQSGSGE